MLSYFLFARLQHRELCNPEYEYAIKKLNLYISSNICMSSSNYASYQKNETWEALNILNEVHFKASLSGGKGGQNVNKVSTKIELYWVPRESKLIDEEVKLLLLDKLSGKLSKEGELRIVCEEDRSQLKNKEKAIQKFYSLLTSCFKVKKKRKATLPTKSSVVKRLEGKSKQKNTKANRRKPDF